jgi:hypothetical protein
MPIRGTLIMARSDWILPRADVACGRVFHADRRTAEGYRIAMEFWNQATGRTRAGYRLGAYRCKRCGGFHVSRRKIKIQPLTPSEVVLTSDAALGWPDDDSPLKSDLFDSTLTSDQVSDGDWHGSSFRT